MAPAPQAFPSFAPPVTISPPLGPDPTSLATDPLHSGTISDIVTPTITITSSPSPPTPTSDSPSKSNGVTFRLSAGIIIGITIGVFIVLAACLIVFMHIRNKQRLKIRKMPYLKRSHMEEERRVADTEWIGPPINTPPKAHTVPYKLDPAMMIQTSIPNPFLISPVSSTGENSQLPPPTPTATERDVRPILFTNPTISQLPKVPRMDRVPMGRVEAKNASAHGPGAIISLSTSPSDYEILSAGSDYGSDASTPLDAIPNHLMSSQSGKPWSPLAPRASLHAPSLKTNISVDKAAARTRELRAMQALIEALEEGDYQRSRSQSRRSSYLSPSSRLTPESSLRSDGAGRRTNNDFTSITESSLPPAALFRAGLGLEKRA